MSEVPSEVSPAAPRRGGYAVLVAAGILLSRLAGLVRERVFAHYLGSSYAADAFKVALRVPNFLQNLFGEGVLSASFIPVYARLIGREDDEKLAGRVAGVFVSLLALIVSIVVLAGMLLTPAILSVTAPGFKGEVRELTIRLVRILFPGAGLLVLSAWCLGILNSHRKFFLSYVSPVLWNIAMIATLVMFGSRLAQPDLAFALAWGTLVGSALQFGIQLPFVFRYARHLSFGFDRKLAEVRAIFGNLGTVVVGRGVVQLSAYIDQIIASLLPYGSVASLSYAQTIYLLPISLFGMSVAAAELPQMASQRGDAGEVHAAIRSRLERGLRQIAFFVIPTVVAFILIGRLLVAALYQTGRFGPKETTYVWTILAALAVGLFAVTQGRLYSSAFYALGDTRTPLRIAIARVVSSAALGVVLAFPLRAIFVAAIEASRLPLPPGGEEALGTVGLAVASSAGGWLEFLLLRRALQHRVGRIAFPVAFQLRVWVAALAAGGSAFLFQRLLAGSIRLPQPHISLGLLACAIFGVVYLVATMALGIPEAKAMLARLRRR